MQQSRRPMKENNEKIWLDIAIMVREVSIHLLAPLVGCTGG